MKFRNVLFGIMALAVIGLVALFADVARAGDYAIVRDNGKMPGGGTNTAVVLPHPSGFGGELIEFHVWGGGGDTASVSRVSWCKCVTNSLAVMALPGPTSTNLLGSPFITVSQAIGANDFVLVAATGTNTFNYAAVWRVHSGR